MRVKTAPWKGNDYPGPGSYSPPGDFHPTGIYRLSKYQDSRAPKIGPLSKKTPVNPPETVSPGPCAYNPKPNISKTGVYFLQGFENSKCRTFGKASRRIVSLSMSGTHHTDTPGPGAYSFPSDFGPLPAITKPQKPAAKPTTVIT